MPRSELEPRNFCTNSDSTHKLGITHLNVVGNVKISEKVVCIYCTIYILSKKTFLAHPKIKFTLS
jgi:hypothetical protein